MFDLAIFPLNFEFDGRPGAVGGDAQRDGLGIFANTRAWDREADGFGRGRWAASLGGENQRDRFVGRGVMPPQVSI